VASALRSVRGVLGGGGAQSTGESKPSPAAAATSAAKDKAGG
jgi:hypothetical protein